eukprot:2856876-Rhodomonas_salina.1
MCIRDSSSSPSSALFSLSHLSLSSHDSITHLSLLLLSCPSLSHLHLLNLHFSSSSSAKQLSACLPPSLSHLTLTLVARTEEQRAAMQEGASQFLRFGARHLRQLQDVTVRFPEDRFAAVDFGAVTDMLNGCSALRRVEMRVWAPRGEEEGR